MAKIDKHIEFVRPSTQKNYQSLVDALKSRYTHVGITNVDNVKDLKLLVTKQPDLVFLRIKKLPGTTNHSYVTPDTIWISEYLDDHGINYTGSTVAAITLDFDKAQANRVIDSAGLNTPAFFIVKEDEQSNMHEQSLNFPLFVKPLNRGDGVGIGADSVVRNFDSLEQKVSSIIKNFHGTVLVEEYLPGREFSVALLKDASSENLLAMPIEIITDVNDNGDRILGENVKREDTEQVLAVPEGHIRTSVINLARKAFSALGARDYGRIDIRLDNQGNPSFIETNLIPGLRNGYFTRACWINRQMDYSTMVLQIASSAFARQDDSR